MVQYHGLSFKNRDNLTVLRVAASNRKAWRAMRTIMVERHEEYLKNRMVKKRGPKRKFTAEVQVRTKRIRFTVTRQEGVPEHDLVLRVRRRRREETEEQEMEARNASNNGVRRTRNEQTEAEAEYNLDQRRNY